MPPEAGDRRVLLVRLHGDLYGIPSHAVQEIVAGGVLSGGVARLPGADESVVGLLNLRGRLLTVVDLGQRIVGIQARVADPVVLVVSAAGRSLALLVDDVEDVEEVELDAEAAVGGRFLSGAGRLADKVVLIVDVNVLVAETLV